MKNYDIYRFGTYNTVGTLGVCRFYILVIPDTSLKLTEEMDYSFLNKHTVSQYNLYF